MCNTENSEDRERGIVAHSIVADLERLPQELLDDDVALYSRVGGYQPHRGAQRLGYDVTAQLLLACAPDRWVFRLCCSGSMR